MTSFPPDMVSLDMDNDGFSDLVVGDYRATSSSGLVYILFGSPNITSFYNTSTQSHTDCSCIVKNYLLVKQRRRQFIDTIMTKFGNQFFIIIFAVKHFFV